MGFFMIFLIVFKLFFVVGTIFSLLTAINPHLVWHITEEWKSHKKPPKSYFVIQRMKGIIGAIIGLIALFFMFFNAPI
ncbi:hypothetical protein HNQ80_004153 [Anaerosolibacter carboniphilus]|uniref:DUF6199 domain-containing protein n=1 Tax=Anaerosolibacter carboniphilus TaxID=1417629 RepID=A0A841KWF6_9FIRM|nr:DUF6199 family natural product biosynthesis protein [Anaerosolibacter carboniphilus]MBB6218016.1 hypothetical protein [Anaerosolibacter carboniphilus]